MAKTQVEIEKLAAEILKIQKEYATIFRHIVSPTRYRLALERQLIQPADVADELIRESDLEHIGHLPIVATIIHPHLEHAAEVDLAKTLLYLAIHDAPERITGDRLSYDKGQAEDDEELAAAEQIFVGPYANYLTLYQDFHFTRTIEAKFAVSIDKIASFFYHVYQQPELRRRLWQHHNITIQKVLKKYADLMVWDATMQALFNHVLTTIEKQEQQFNN